MTHFRKIALASAAIGAFMAAGSAASAQGFSSGNWYGKAFGGATWMQDQDGDIDLRGNDFTTGDASYDAGYVLGLGIGYNYTPNFAFELEYAYRNADTDTDIAGVDTFGGSTNSNAVMLNALYKFDGMGAMGAVVPYVGGGMGWANMESDIDDIGSFKRDNAFAWQVMGGVGYDINPNVSLFGEVRYFATDSGELSGPDNLSWEAQVETVDLLVGVTYKF